MTALFALAFGYLLGSIPVGLLIGRAAGHGDIRHYGSGKTGFTNVLRMAGIRWAMLVVVLDVAKGAVPVLVARLAFDEPLAAAVAGVAAVVGHTWPVFAGFRGGRGVATIFGAFLAMSPIAALSVFAFGLVVLAIWRYASLMSVTGVFVGLIVLVGLVIANMAPAEYLIFGVIATLSVEYNHVDNIRRLRAGTEPKIGQGGVRRVSPGT